MTPNRDWKRCHVSEIGISNVDAFSVIYTVYKFINGVL